jgi:SAM-dependent methyltransferase
MCLPPADHALSFARQGIDATALDRSPEMATYARERAAAEGVELRSIVGDMRDFRMEVPFDLAATMLDTASYLLTNDDVRRHLRAVAGALVAGGVYVMELSHPRDLFSPDRSTADRWHVDTPAGRLDVEWLAVEGSFDPITQTTESAAKLTQRAADGSVIREIVDRCRQRAFTANEIEALVIGSGLFDLVAWYGALSVDVALDASEGAWRMVPVLVRRT